MGSVSTLSTDVTAVKACLTDPTASACTSVYSGASTLPASVSTLSTDLTPVKACMTDPSAAGMNILEVVLNPLSDGGGASNAPP